MSSIRFSIVVTMNKLRGIGKEGGLPWRLKEAQIVKLLSSLHQEVALLILLLLVKLIIVNSLAVIE